MEDVGITISLNADASCALESMKGFRLMESP